MLSTNVIDFRENIFEPLEQAICYNEPANINTRADNTVLIGKEDYNSLIETLYLSSLPRERAKVIEGLHTPLEDYLSEDEVTR